jgi:hypothetical protein
MDPDPDPDQDFELDPDPDQNNADPQCGSSVADPDPKDLWVSFKKTSLFQFDTNPGLDINIGVRDATIPVLRIENYAVPVLST